MTVADVCSGARVAKRNFYEHFADRADLIAAVHRQQNDWLLTSLIGAVPERAASLDDLVPPAMRALVGHLRAHPESARVIYINAPRGAVRRRGVILRDAEILGHFLRRTVGHGQDRLRYDRTLLALVAGVSEVLVEWIAHDMADDPDLLAEHLTGIALALLADRPG